MQETESHAHRVQLTLRDCLPPSQRSEDQTAKVATVLLVSQPLASIYQLVTCIAVWESGTIIMPLSKWGNRGTLSPGQHAPLPTFILPCVFYSGLRGGP